jgi:hypothetical protein
MAECRMLYCKTKVLSVGDCCKDCFESMPVDDSLTTLLMMWHEVFGAECYNDALVDMDEKTCRVLGIKK